jgi:uncharacterized repeat protein (TIGR01451 family)
VLTASAAAAPGTDVICDTATVTASNETRIDTGNDADTECTSIVRAADLGITKADDADPPPPGADLTYTITVTNHGPSQATSVVVTDPLPAAVTYVSDTCGGANVPPWTWNIGTLAPGAVVSCDVVVSINPSPPGSVSNTASVDGAEADPNSLNDSDTEETTLDNIPPEVDLLDSILGTGDGALAECESALVPIGRLVVTFSEAMADPPGDGGAADVTNPASYLLVAPGPDLAFDTTLCPTPAGDDTAAPVAGVVYDSGTFVATVDFGALADGPHRLLICPSLTDVAGNPLDGDGDDTGGDEFVRNFRVDAANRLANGHFDCDLAAWTIAVATPGEAVWSGADADGAAESGAATVTNLMPGFDTTFALGQCAENLVAIDQELLARVRLAAAPLVFVGLTRACEFFSAPGCSGSLGTSSSTVLVADSAGAWNPVNAVVAPPLGTVSARCDFRFETPIGAAFTADLDNLFLGAPGLIFADGFESGDPSAWFDCSGVGCP